MSRISIAQEHQGLPSSVAPRADRGRVAQAVGRIEIEHRFAAANNVRVSPFDVHDQEHGRSFVSGRDRADRRRLVSTPDTRPVEH